MMNRFNLTMAWLGLVGGIALAADEKPDLSKLPPAAKGTMDFQRDIQPIFAKSCVSCHGPAKQRGGLRLDDGTEALLGGNTGPAIKPGKATESRLLHLVAGVDADLQMPPKDSKVPPLTAEQLGKLRAWIDQGAKWPKEATASTSGPKSDHWAFLPPLRPELPKVANKSWVRNEIDAFILARLEAENMRPSAEADRVTLIRRLSFDLLGLPPTPQDVDEFLRDTQPDAYERLVDRLLASPHYGERWGRHWLDAARYADSDGFEKDTGRPHAWRYRNWVIEALNRDVPFNQFTIEQLAGDLLPNATVEQKVATGFHRNTLTNKEGGVDPEQFRVEQVVDRVNTTAKVFLGVTIGCAQCHDHKYDPFSQREYYQLLAFFNSDQEVDIDAPVAGDVEKYNQAKAAFDKKKAELEAGIAAYKKDSLPTAQQKWESELKLPELRKLPANIRAILLLEPDKRNDKQKSELAENYAEVDAKLAQLNKALADHQKNPPTMSKAQTLALGSSRKTHVMIRGDFLRPGAEVQPGTPGVLLSIKMGDQETNAARSGPSPADAPRLPTRLDLAKWIVDPANPLTARVAVNWMWQKYFGRSLVATPEDFGTRGEKPSHPELLDWLATEFMTPSHPPLRKGGTHGGWSMKAMHKLIVTSAAYRQSSESRPELVARDPLNVLLARQSRLRLEGEIIRDNALAASGLLNRAIGGRSVRPPQPPGISELTYAGSAKWVESTGPERYRRGMYTWFQRTSPYPMLMTFDSPDSNVCCVRRERSNTPLQALTMLNDTVFVEAAQALGKRIVADRPKETASDRIRYAFRLCLAREPSDKELAVLSRLFDDLLAQCKSSPEAAAKLLGPQKPVGVDAAEAAAWVALARTMMNLDEFVTRE